MKFRQAGFRASADLSNDRMNAKIRASQMMKNPYTVIVGEKEETADQVSVRYRGGKQVNGIPTSEFVEEVRKAIDTKAQV